MPWTFAHPAAVLPLRRFCPRWLNWPALVIGSLVPDLGYYLHALDLSRLMHRFPDGLAACVLAGLILLVPFYALRRPMCQLLPQPHRGALLALIAARPAFSFLSLAALMSMMLSLAIGAVTHMAWDGLTHRGGWAVMRALALQEPLFFLWGTGVPAYQALQHLSTLIGVVALAWVYARWLKREGFRVSLYGYARKHREEHWRYQLLGVIAAVAVISASFSAVLNATPSPGKFLLDRFVFFFAVHSALAFAVLFTAAALGYQWQRRRARRKFISI